MKKGVLAACAVLSVAIFLAGSVEAKWWVFGKPEGPVETRYLFINGISYDQEGTKITLYKDMLRDGLIFIRGKAQAAGNRKVGAVMVSIDNKEKWERAKLAADGSIEFSFRPEPERTYKIYLKIIDTVGKSNDVDKTLKEVTVSNRNIMGIVKEALDKLASDYRKEDAGAFMSMVRGDFEPDRSTLDRAVRRDFTLFDSISLNFTIVGIASDAKGQIAVSLSFTRSVTSSRSGKAFSDKGTTELSLIPDGSKLLLVSMKSPLIFGLSDSANVSSGTVNSGSADPLIVVDGRGDVRIGSADSASPGSSSAGGGSGTGGFASGSPGSGATGIPAPVKLTASGMKHHMVDLSFDHPFGATGLISYEVIAEEATSPNGPWFEVIRKPGDTFVRVMSQLIAQKAILLYYRVRIVKGGDSSPPSNVVTWDNQ